MPSDNDIPPQLQLLHQKFITEVRDIIRQESRESKDQIREFIQNYFGDMTPATHAAEHQRYARLVGNLDKVSEGFWENLGSRISNGLLILVLIAAIAWFHFFGDMPELPKG